MRIGIMLQSLHHRGGIGSYTQHMVRHLLRLDRANEYVLLFPSFGQAHMSYGRFRNSYDNVTEVLSHSAIPHGYYWDHCVVPRLAARYALDVVFNPFVSIPVLGRFKRLFVMHNSEWFLMPEVFWLVERYIGRTKVKLFMQVSDLVISVSHKVATDLMELAGLPSHKFRVIHNAADERFRPIADDTLLAVTKERYRLPDDFLLFVGGLYPQKNFHGLLRAFHQASGSIPHTLVVAGNLRWKNGDDLALVQRLGLENRVHLLGWVEPDDLPALYNLATCFVQPSFHESCSIALLEAMSCGCPVIASSTGGNAEVMGDAGVMVDPTNTEELTTAIVRAVSDPALRRELAARALARSQSFTWEKSAKATLDVFQEFA